MNVAKWSIEEFGNVQLGDGRRTSRLVAMGARLAQQPAGKITEAFTEPAEREAAFRFVENDQISAASITQGVALVTAQRAQSDSFVFVPMDSSSLTLSDQEGKRQLGPVGTRKANAQGVHVMSAIAISEDLTPLGIIGQSYWKRNRQAPPRNKKIRDKRPAEAKETQYWLEVMQQVQHALSQNAPNTRPWFQMDRGADAWPVLSNAEDAN